MFPARLYRLIWPPAPTGTIDSRYPLWDPPAQAIATLCNFVPLETTERWQVLGRTVDRCGEPQPAGTVASSYGEPVSVPAPARGEVVFAKVHGVAIGGLERIRAAFHYVGDNRTVRPADLLDHDALVALIASVPASQPASPSVARSSSSS